MSVSSETSVEDAVICDADFHNTVEIETLLEYVEDARVERKVRTFGVPRQSSPWSPNYARKVEDGFHALGRARNREEIVEAKASMSVDTVVVNPNLGSTLSASQWDVVKTELVRAYNTFLIEELADPSAGIYGTVLLPQWDVEESVREVRRCASHDGVVGAQGYYTGTVRFGESPFDALFDELTARDLPLALHGGGYSLFDRLQTYNEAVTFEWPSMAIVNVLNMIFSGVFDAYPTLTVLLQEAGVNWIPFVANRADEMYQTGPDDVQFTERLFERDQTYLERLPSEYLFRNFYYTTQPIALPNEGRHAEAMLEMCDAENTFVFSSDWPHSTTDLPTWLFENPKVSERMRRKICHENAAEVFGL
ncbi:amidohydrolase family protein [Natronobiforma cellulositropha]|uniref:amidohydrolase family protein n=1 Tax=Natronobiforma cellulositropha TaxID=1679076 RepID=UPI0021D5D658|nr:amidohydrolase family protein [Natronobiforma cellulositropha]